MSIILDDSQKGISNFLKKEESGFVIVQMGKGKTIACLDYIQNKENILVVAPEIVIKDAWEKDATKLGLEPFNNIRETKKFTGRDIVDYSFLKNCEGLKYDSVFFDEVTACKNSSSDTSKACYNITADRKIGLTATPVHTNILIAYGMLKLISPEKLLAKGFTSKKKWENYFYTDLVGTGERIVNYYRSKYHIRYARKGWQKLLASFFVPSYIDMEEPNKENEIFYHYFKVDLEKETKKEIANIRKSDFTSAKKHTLIYQLGEKEKTNFLIQILRKATSKKIVIFTMYTYSFNYLKERITHDFEICSSMSIEERKRQIDLFNTSEKAILLASVKCCSHGISLNSTDLGIYFNVINDYEVYAQSIRRMFRRDKNKDLKVFLLYTTREELKRLEYFEQKKLEIFYEECKRANGGG